MGDNIAKLIKSCKKSTKKESNTEETEAVAADIAKDLNNLFHLKEEAVAPKSVKKDSSKRMSLAADMADSLVGLFASPRAPMASSEEMEVDEPEEEPVDFSELKVAELREECTKRDLDAKGVKAALIKRLNEASAAGASTKRSIEEVEGDVEEAPAAKKAVVEETVDFKKLKVAELGDEEASSDSFSSEEKEKREKRSKDKKLPDHINFPMDGKDIVTDSIKVDHVLCSENTEQAISIFTPQPTHMETAVASMNVLLNFSLFNDAGHLAFAMQGAGASSSGNDTCNFSIYTRGLKWACPALADFATRLGKEIRLKKVTLNRPGCCTGRHTDDLSSHREGETQRMCSSCLSMSISHVRSLYSQPRAGFSSRTLRATAPACPSRTSTTTTSSAAASS